MSGKISELVELSATDVATDDQFEIRDTSAGASGSKSITVAELRKGVFSREVLTANRDYYVRTDGNDSNTGLANTAGGAWLTLQHAFIWICGNIDFNSLQVTINIADGTYAGVTGYDLIADPDYNIVRSPVGNGNLKFQGNEVSPQNVIIQATDGSDGCCFDFFAPTANILVNGVTLDLTNQFAGVLVNGNLQFTLTKYRIMNGAGKTIFSVGLAARLFTLDGVECVGSFDIFADVSYHSFFNISQNTVTLVFTGSPVIGTVFVKAGSFSIVALGTITTSGVITGTRYVMNSNSILYAGGAVLPGTVGGSVSSGGQVI